MSRVCAWILGLLAWSAPAAARAPLAAGAEDALVRAAGGELARAMEALGTRPDPPYWIGLGVVDREVLEVQATHGSAGPISQTRVRLGDVDVRVGSFALDNTHKLRDAGPFDEPERPEVDLPLDDAAPAVTAHAFWAAIDASYRAAARRLIQVRTNQAVKVEREDRSDDFSPAPAVVDLGAVADAGAGVDPLAWQALVREASAVFLQYPQVYDSNVTLRLQDDVVYTLTSEGTRVREQRVLARVAVWGGTVADDGMELAVYDYVDAAAPGGLPAREAVVQMAHAVARQVTALRAAPVVDPYVGPAILRGRAAAVFFHEILGHRAEGHRQKDEEEGQTLRDKVGERIFPPFLSVVDDPTQRRIGAVDLSGHYRYDDEGVAAQRVPLVEDGVYKGFLMSRAPIDGFARSNGHGRRQPGAAPVARQGNLLVSARDPLPDAALRAELLKLLKTQGRPFGLIFDDISGGFTFTGRSTPNSYAVQPVTVWRVWADGRPDELVRGVDLIGTPLLTFGRIVAGSDRVEVFNGMCGAESGWVPVSAAAPALLVSEVEVQRRDKGNDRPPVLPVPGAP